MHRENFARADGARQQMEIIIQQEDRGQMIGLFNLRMAIEFTGKFLSQDGFMRRGFVRVGSLARA